MPVAKLRMRALRSGKVPSSSNSLKSATYPYVFLLVGSSACSSSRAAGQRTEGEPAELIDDFSAKIVEAGHSPSNLCVLHYAFVTHT